MLFRSVKRMPLLRNLLGYVGINPERFILDWVSSAEAPKFAKVTSEFAQTIRELGPIAEEMGLVPVQTPENIEEVAA